jgi:nucleoside-diphosphate-sugar epimerase
MNVLILGGNGFLGPHLVKALEEGDYRLRVTDIKPIDSPHQTMLVDVADYDQVRRAAEGMDVIVNCSVLRPHRKIAFDVNTLGTYNAVRAAAESGHTRFINTGPHFTVSGDAYHDFDFAIPEDIPPHSGRNLYALSKAAGQEICRTFSDAYPLHVLCLLFLNFRPAQPKAGETSRELNPFSVTFPDAARALRRALETDLDTLPSRNEIFYILADLPHGKYSNAKAKRLLGWQPQDKLEAYWRKPQTGSEQG